MALPPAPVEAKRFYRDNNRLGDPAVTGAKLQIEISVDYGLTDIVAERYDAGVRWGEQVAKDMIALRIGPDIRFAVVAAKPYFEKRPPTKHRRT